MVMDVSKLLVVNYLGGRTTENETAELANYIGIGTHVTYQQREAGIAPYLGALATVTTIEIKNYTQIICIPDQI
jgi:hypothetical protein